MSAYASARHFNWFCSKGDSVSHFDFFRHFIWRESRIDDQVFHGDHAAAFPIGEQVGGRHGDHAIQVFARRSMDDDGRAGQHARVDAADACHKKETVQNAIDHHTDGVHVGGDHHGRAGLLLWRTSFQSVNRAEFAGGDFIHKRGPLLFDDIGDGGFVSRYACNRDEGFEKGDDVAHGVPPNAVGDGAGVLDGVQVGVRDGVIDEVGVEDGVMDGVNVGVMDGVSVKVAVFVGGRNGVKVTVGDGVSVGVDVSVNVEVIVSVKIIGVGLRVGVSVVTVSVIVGVEVARGLGAKESAMNPAQ